LLLQQALQIAIYRAAQQRLPLEGKLAFARNEQMTDEV